jgi:hypothetical protein
MLVFDTNVVSAMMGTRPVPEVEAWVARYPIESLFTTAINQAEILAGLAIMPDGRRRDLEPDWTPDCDTRSHASIARGQGGIVVTRNTADFEGCGIALINPWA